MRRAGPALPRRISGRPGIFPATARPNARYARYQREVLPRVPKNAKNLRPQLDWWRSQLGDLNLAAVTPSKIAECRERLLTPPTARGKLRSPATAVRYLAVLSHAFSVALREWDWVNDNPLRKVIKPKEPRGRVRFLDDDERT